MNAYKERQRQSFVWQAEQMLWFPYIWGGDDPRGFDCSGLVVECLKGVGRLSPEQDLTADGLHKLYSHYPEADETRGGCLLFWGRGSGREQHMVHVAVARDRHFCITADGGGSHVRNVEDAYKYNAFIKLRPILHRGRPPIIVDIFAELDDV